MGRASDANGGVRTHNTNLAAGRPLVSNWNWISSGGQQLELDLQWRLNGGHWTQLPLAVALLKRPLDATATGSDGALTTTGRPLDVQSGHWMWPCVKHSCA